MANIPQLEGDAADAVAHRGSHIQIIAAAGSGKTEVVSQRVASLLSDGEAPESIVAFTFTEKAASELKERIRERVTARMGIEATDQLGRLFVGTIHAYCFRMLQTYVPRYETYTPLDMNQLTNFVYRQSNFIGVKNLSPTDGTFKSIATFQRGIDVLENELIDLESFPPVTSRRQSTRITIRHSIATNSCRSAPRLCEQSRRFRTRPFHAAVTDPIRHLIVDEYQDVGTRPKRS